MKIELEVPDHRGPFVLELLHSLPFVKVKAQQKNRKAVAQAELRADLQEAIVELNEVLAGRKQARNAYDLLDEL